MGKRTASLICVTLLLGLAAGTARADLLAYYPFDEGSGTTAADATGNGNDGTFNGSVEWVPGYRGTAVRLDTAGERVVIGPVNPSGANNAMTLAAWINWEGSGHATITHQGVFGKRQGWTDEGETVKWFWEAQPDDDLSFRTRSAAVTATDALVDHQNEWVHVALTWDNGTTIHYINGAQIHTGSITFNETSNDVIVTIGCVSATNNETFVGSIDEARIYDHVLSSDELTAAMKGIGPEQAFGPNPKDGAMFGETWAQLKWKPGAYAVTHNVYMGTNFDDVNQAAEGTFLGSTAEASFVVGVQNAPFPDGLVPGTTYYWRVDEVNDVNPGSPWQGQVWSFWIPPRAAYAPYPGDAVAYVPVDAQLSWSPGLKAFMRTVYFGTDADTVANASGGLPQLETTFDPGPLEFETTYYWRVDEFDGPAWRTGPVWSFTTVPEIPVEDPSLMLRWTLDEGEGLTAVDWSGHGCHGTIHGDAQWMVGYQGTALMFDDDVYVEAAGYPGVTGVDPRTLCAWIKSDTANRNIMSWGQNVAGEKWRMRIDATGGLRIEVNGGYHYGVTNIADGQWHHVAVTFEDDGSPDVVDTLLYVDGRLDATAASQETAVNTAATGAVRIGESPWHNAPFFGLIDDARIYNKVLTEADMQQVMRGDPLLAWDLEPANGRTFDIRDVTSLSWQAGDMAAEHDVYLGFDAGAVLNADTSDTSGIYRGRQAGTTYVPPGGFAWGKTHYWRIDEINTDGSVSKGGVRTFTIADFLPIDDFESYTDDDGSRIYQTWIDGYTNGLSGSMVGYIEAPFAEQTIVHGGRQSMPLEYNNIDSPWYSEAERTLDAVEDWTDQGVTHLSLWLRGNPVSYVETGPGAFTMSASGVDIWGTADEFRFAHKRLNGNGSIVAKVESIGNTNGWAKGGVMIRETLDPGSKFAYVVATPAQGVSFGWRQFASNTCNSATQAGLVTPQWVKLTRTGDVFTAQYSADGKTWTDITDANGQVVQTTITMAGNVYIGLCVTSHNATAVTTAAFSEVATTGSVSGAWQPAEIGVDHPGNVPDELYVALRDSAGKVAVVTHPDPAIVNVNTWTQWEIPLSSFTGVNLKRVDTIVIGVGDPANPTPGGNGLIYIDDIALTRPEADEPAP